MRTRSCLLPLLTSCFLALSLAACGGGGGGGNDNNANGDNGNNNGGATPTATPDTTGTPAPTPDGTPLGTPDVTGDPMMTPAPTPTGPCTVDADCERTEACVNGGCVPLANIPLNITTERLPDALLNAEYQGIRLAVENDISVSWEIASGGLPPGITLNAVGDVAGTPTEEGDFDVTFKATANNGQVGERAYTLTVIGRNDTCASAVEVLLGDEELTLRGDTRGALDDYEGSCFPSQGPDVVYRFVLEERARVTADLFPVYNGMVYIKGGDCDALGDLACASGGPVTSGELGAGPYHVIVDGLGRNDAGTYSLKLSKESLGAAAENDSCDTPTTSPTSPEGGATIRGSLGGATARESNSCPGSVLGKDVVYQVELPALTMTQVTVSAGVNLAVKGADCGSPQTLICLEGGDVTPVTHTVPSFTAGTYHLIVEQREGSAVEDFRIDIGSGGIEGQNCADAVPIELGLLGVANENGMVPSSWETPMDDAPSCFVPQGARGWFAIDVPEAGQLSVTASRENLGMSVRDGGCDAGAEKGCIVGPWLNVSPVSPGLHHLLLDQNIFADGGDYSIDVAFAADGAEPALGTCAEPIDVSLQPGEDFVLRGNTAFSQNADLEGTCGGPGVESVYRLSVTDALRLTATSNQVAGPGVTVYIRNTCEGGGGVELGCSDAPGGLDVNVPADSTWFLIVDGRDGLPRGPFEITVAGEAL